MILLYSDILEYLVNHTDLNTPADYISQYCTPHFITLDNGKYCSIYYIIIIIVCHCRTCVANGNTIISI